MSDNVKVPYGDSVKDTAVLLLAAAEEKGLDASVVQYGSSGYFTVPEEVASAAGVDTVDPDAEFNAEIEKARKEANAEEYRVEQGLPPTSNPAVEPIAPIGDNGPDAAEQTSTDSEQKATAKKTAAKKTAAKER